MTWLKRISIAVFIIFILSFFIPIQTTTKGIIKRTFYDIVVEINNPDSWKKWFEPIKSSYQKKPKSFRFEENYKNKNFTIYTQNNKYTVTKYSPGTIKIEDNAFLNTTHDVSITLSTTGNSVIYETYSTSLLNFMISYFNKPRFSVTNNLKNFMETPSLYYGFQINRTAVPDTSYIVNTQTSLLKNRYKITDSLYKSLREFAIKNKILKSFNPYLVTNTIGKDSIKIMAMLVVDNNKEYYGKISSFIMPKSGNMLSAKFKGNYGESKKVYDALLKYVFDNSLSSVFTPFERYVDNKVPKNDSSKVDIEVFYPIY